MRGIGLMVSNKYDNYRLLTSLIWRCDSVSGLLYNVNEAKKRHKWECINRQTVNMTATGLRQVPYTQGLK